MSTLYNIKVATITIEIFHRNISTMGGFVKGLRFNVGRVLENNRDADMYRDENLPLGISTTDDAGALHSVARMLVGIENKFDSSQKLHASDMIALFPGVSAER